MEWIFPPSPIFFVAWGTRVAGEKPQSEIDIFLLVSRLSASVKSRPRSFSRFCLRLLWRARNENRPISNFFFSFVRGNQTMGKNSCVQRHSPYITNKSFSITSRSPTRKSPWSARSLNFRDKKSSKWDSSVSFSHRACGNEIYILVYYSWVPAQEIEFDCSAIDRPGKK